MNQLIIDEWLDNLNEAVAHEVDAINQRLRYQIRNSDEEREDG
jgi:hypothetical protein